MASIDTRKRANGTVAYRIRWRFGGKRDGAAQSLTYDNRDDAKAMKGAIEARGHRIYDTDPAVVDFSLVTGMRIHSYTAPTFGEIAERYIKSRTNAKESSRDQYRHTVKSYLSGLVNRPIESIIDDDIRDVLSDIKASGRSAKASFELMWSVFKFALNKGMLSNGNPCVFVEAPKASEKIGVYLTSGEAGWILAKCAQDKSPAVGAALTDFVEVVLGTGLRISEGLGLIVDDVHVDDIHNAWIDVSRQLSRPSKANPAPRRVSLKTKAAKRRISLDEGTARLIARLIAGKLPIDPVFVDPIDGGWWTQSRVGNAWARARKLALAEGMAKSPRMHDLRHTHTAWLITDGVPLLAISRRLGHESISITCNIYGHLLAEADDAVKISLTSRRAAMVKGPGTAKTRATAGPRTRKASTSTRATRGALAAAA